MLGPREQVLVDSKVYDFNVVAFENVLRSVSIGHPSHHLDSNYHRLRVKLEEERGRRPLRALQAQVRMHCIATVRLKEWLSVHRVEFRKLSSLEACEGDN